MPRSDDYRVNDAGWGPSYSIQVQDIGLELYGRTPIDGRFGDGITTAPGGPGERPLLFDSFVNGMGMAYSGVPNTYAFAKNMYLRGPKKAMPGGLRTEISLDTLGLTADELAGEIRAAFDTPTGDVLIGAGRHILRLIGGTGDPVDEYDTGVDTQIQDGLIYNDVPVFSTDQYADNWQYLTAYDALSSAWVTANSDGTQPGYSVRAGAAAYLAFPRPVYQEHMVKLFMEVDGVGGNRILGNDTPFTYIYTQTSSLYDLIGDTSIYSASLEAGDTTAPITGIYGTNRIPFIGKTDSVRGIESAGIYCPNYVPDLERDVHPQNGAFGVFIFDRLYVSTPQGLLMVDVASKQVQYVPTFVNPSFFFANETPVFGRPTAYTVDNGWLVTSLWNGVDSHICYTRPRDAVPGSTIPAPMVWHGSECTIEGERVTMLHKTSVSGSPQILIGTHDGTRMRLYTLSVPAEGDPYVDYLHGRSAHKFATNGRLFLPIQDAEDSTAKKVIRRFDVQADGLSLPVLDPDGHPTGDVTQAGQVTFYANADSGSRVFFETVEPGTSVVGDGQPDSEWVEQGVVDSNTATLIPSLQTMSGKQIGVLLDWQLLNQSGDEANPVYTPFSIRSVKIRTDLYVEDLESKTYTVLLGHMQRTDIGGRDAGDAQSKFVTLAALQNADVVYMINEWHERLLVKVERGLGYQFVREDTSQPPSLVVIFRITVMGRQFYWDVGHTYDSVYSWGS